MRRSVRSRNRYRCLLRQGFARRRCLSRKRWQSIGPCKLLKTKSFSSLLTIIDDRTQKKDMLTRRTKGCQTLPPAALKGDYSGAGRNAYWPDGQFWYRIKVDPPTDRRKHEYFHFDQQIQSQLPLMRNDIVVILPTL